MSDEQPKPKLKLASAAKKAVPNTTSQSSAPAPEAAPQAAAPTLKVKQQAAPPTTQATPQAAQTAASTTEAKPQAMAPTPPKMGLARADTSAPPPATAKPATPDAAASDTPVSPPKMGLAKPCAQTPAPTAAKPTAPAEAPVAPEGAPPPPLPKPAATAPGKSDASALERNLDDVQESKGRGKTLVSVLIVALLLFIFAAAAGGIWWVLKGPSADTSPMEAGTPAQSPIDKAKETVAKVTSEQDVNEVLASPAATVSGEAPTVATPALPQADQLQAEITQFLSHLTIDGVRTGASAKVMIGGQSYQIGEVVHPASGLIFEGTRDGRLAFKDTKGIVYLKSF